MAKLDKKLGASRADMAAYDELNRGLSDPFAGNQIRVDPGHAIDGARPRAPHGHEGLVDLIPLADP